MLSRFRARISSRRLLDASSRRCFSFSSHCCKLISNCPETMHKTALPPFVSENTNINNAFGVEGLTLCLRGEMIKVSRSVESPPGSAGQLRLFCDYFWRTPPLHGVSVRAGSSCAFSTVVALRAWRQARMMVLVTRCEVWVEVACERALGVFVGHRCKVVDVDVA